MLLKALIKHRKKLLKNERALEFALKFWGGKKILGEFFLSRSLSIGVPYSDAVRVFNKITSLKDWVKLWYELGLEREKIAQAAEREGRMQSAVAFWMMTRAAFHMAQFPFYGNFELKQKIYRRCASAYSKAAPYLHPPAIKVLIPYESSQLHGYLRIPEDGTPESCIILLGGIDGVKEEMHYYANYYVHRGFSVLYFDAPGLGQTADSIKMNPDFKKLGYVLYHFLKDYEAHPFEKIGLLGLSLGANMAVHTASVTPIDSCVVISPPYDPKVYFKDLFFLVQRAVFHLIGGRSRLDDFMEKISLVDVVRKVKCPLFVMGGGHDPILPGREAIKLYEAASEPKKILYYPEGTHCCPEQSIEIFWEVEKWFRKTLS